MSNNINIFELIALHRKTWADFVEKDRLADMSRDCANYPVLKKACDEASEAHHALEDAIYHCPIISAHELAEKARFAFEQEVLIYPKRDFTLEPLTSGELPFWALKRDAERLAGIKTDSLRSESMENNIFRQLELLAMKTSEVEAHTKAHKGKSLAEMLSGPEEEFNGLCSDLANLEDALAEMPPRNMAELVGKARYFLGATTSPPEAFEEIAADILRLASDREGQMTPVALTKEKVAA